VAKRGGREGGREDVRREGKVERISGLRERGTTHKAPKEQDMLMM
jgi:hypothetical protein